MIFINPAWMLAGDRLDGSRSTRLKERDRAVMEAAKMRGIPLVITLGGGYGIEIERTAEAHANTFRVAAETYGAS